MKLQIMQCDQCGKRSEAADTNHIFYGWSRLSHMRVSGSSMRISMSGEEMNFCTVECLRIFINEAVNEAVSDTMILDYSKRHP